MRRLRQQPSVVSMTDLMIIILKKRLTGKLTIRKARKWSRDRKYMAKCAQEDQQWEKAKAQRPANVKHEEAKKSEFRLKMLSKLLNEKDEAEAYITSTVLGFLLTWQEATRDEKAIEAKLAQTFVQTEFDRLFW
jgi:hypothetical protein